MMRREDIIDTLNDAYDPWGIIEKEQHEKLVSFFQSRWEMEDANKKKRGRK